MRLLPASDQLIAATTKALIRIDAAGEASRVIPRVPGVGARIARGPSGTWWLAARDAIFIAEGEPSAPATRLGAAHGIVPGAGVFEMAEQETTGMHLDAAGTMWIASTDDRLYRCDVARDLTPRCTQVAHDGLSWRNRPVAMTHDREGTLWVASISGLGRLSGARFEAIPLAPAPKGRPELTPALLVDSLRRLWVGLHHQGLALSRSPRDTVPAFEFFDKTRGLSSDAVFGFAEGTGGVMYAATGRGLDVLRPADARLEPAAVDLGFDTGQVRDVAVVGDTLWVASASGLYWQHLGAPAPRDGAPRVFVTRLTVRGTEWPIPDRGLQHVSGLVFEAGAYHLQIEFLAPHIGMPSPRYQYRLGSTHEWSAPAASHAATLTGLRPDRYAFEVQAVTASGVRSAPAVLEF